MRKRFTVTKGDLGYRIYDRRTKRHAKTKWKMTAWYRTREEAERIAARMEGRY